LWLVLIARRSLFLSSRRHRRQAGFAFYQSENGVWLTQGVYPHLFRRQIITCLSKRGIISPKLQLLSGHAEEKSLAIYRDLASSDVAGEYEEAMRTFPVR
jgi:hypothetical protein